jgi:hypothetical protein
MLGECPGWKLMDLPLFLPGDHYQATSLCADSLFSGKGADVNLCGSPPFHGGTVRPGTPPPPRVFYYN